MTRPSARVRVCHRHSHKPPSTISTSAAPEICGSTVTAPGQPATHWPIHTIASMPKPIALSGQASSPNGMAVKFNSAIGMISRLTMGAASRLAISPYSVMRWK